jgi:hypothetical protein
MVHRPAYVIPFNNVGCNWEKKSQNSSPEILSTIMFHAIPYDRALPQSSDDFTSFSHESQSTDIFNQFSTTRNALTKANSTHVPVGREQTDITHIGSERLPMYLGRQDLNDVYQFILWATKIKKMSTNNNNLNDSDDDLEGNGSDSDDNASKATGADDVSLSDGSEN